MEPLWTDRIVVTDHAIVRARQRLGWDGGESLSRQIRVDVRLSILRECVTSIKPNWTSGGTPPSEDLAGERYIYDPEGTRCWVVGCRDGSLIVKTLLLADSDRLEAAERQLIRPGMVARR